MIVFIDAEKTVDKIQHPLNSKKWCRGNVPQHKCHIGQTHSQPPLTILSTTVGQESLRRNGVALIVNKRAQNAVLGCSLKNDRRISVHFQGKPFNIIVIQVYALTSSVEEAEVECVYEDLQDLLELTPKKDVFFIIGD